MPSTPHCLLTQVVTERKEDEFYSLRHSDSAMDSTSLDDDLTAILEFGLHRCVLITSPVPVSAGVRALVLRALFDSFAVSVTS